MFCTLANFGYDENIPYILDETALDSATVLLAASNNSTVTKLGMRLDDTTTTEDLDET